ncbi:MAG: SCO1664 family protein [Candidatus Limnocylindrales bacterium]
MPAAERVPELTLPTADALRLLRDGSIEIVGRLTEASNATLYCEVRPSGKAPAEDEAVEHAVYKPIRGERPLDDFPHGTLAFREVAAFEVSEALGWGIVPPTTMRDDLPLGPGMVQLWIDVDETADVLEMILTRDVRLRRMALFDAIVNNADRKGGHVLPRDDGHLYGCDHGICFSAEPKLRTVLWGWRGEPLTAEESSCVVHIDAALASDLGVRLRGLLSAREVAAMHRRVAKLIADGAMPKPDPYRPAIPWPPF